MRIIFVYPTTALLAVAFFATSVLAATSPDGLWSDISPNRHSSTGNSADLPDFYRSFDLAAGELEDVLRIAPPERVGAGKLIYLPMPDGSFVDFSVHYSPVMDPDLADRHPEITTYLAVAREDATLTARLDLTPMGFHAIVFSVGGTVYIDPHQVRGKLEYLSYYKRNSQTAQPFRCAFTGGHPITHSESVRHARAPVGDTLRTYRTAVAATGEYTSFHGGSVALGLAAIVTTINRVTGIFERELSVRLSLVANNDSIVYTNPATDPYTNFDSSALLTENQANLDAVIGSANYDIGHVFSGGFPSGLAELAAVCNSASKAMGTSGSDSPVGDPFDVDIVAHEIGHQFGADHTFNGTTGACEFGRNPSTAYEPGSGSTIMSYAGGCGAEDLQMSVDDYFHTSSFDEISTYISGAGNCGAESPTGNTPPTVDAGPSFTVPISTPLVLLANDAEDPDPGQELTYSWEQFDLGAASPPNEDDGSRPIFRSFPAQATTVRYLPRMSDILNNMSTLGESLPTTTRALTFRLTARDNAAGGGGVDYSTVVHQTSDTAGPFEISSQNEATFWLPGSTQSVTWTVANTDAPPVNCDSVDILFSDQEFVQFSGTVLLSDTPNDGSEMVVAPLELTDSGRIMVRCHSNIFFDINDAPITIDPIGLIFEHGFE